MKLLSAVAHGESWEVTASRAVSDLVRKILEENRRAGSSAEHRGSFSLQYTPANVNGKSITIPLSTPNTERHRWSDHSLENGEQQDTPFKNTRRF